MNIQFLKQNGLNAAEFANAQPQSPPLLFSAELKSAAFYIFKSIFVCLFCRGEHVSSYLWSNT